MARYLWLLKYGAHGPYSDLGGKSQVLESLHPADKNFNWRIRIDKGECSQSCLDLKCPKAYFETLEH